jgi:hypothetical protein
VQNLQCRCSSLLEAHLLRVSLYLCCSSKIDTIFEYDTAWIIYIPLPLSLAFSLSKIFSSRRALFVFIV